MLKEASIPARPDTNRGSSPPKKQKASSLDANVFTGGDGGKRSQIIPQRNFRDPASLFLADSEHAPAFDSRREWSSSLAPFHRKNKKRPRWTLMFLPVEMAGIEPACKRRSIWVYEM